MIMVIGDTHCDWDFLIKKLCYAKLNNCKDVIVCGDFGYWPDDVQGKQFLEILDFQIRKHFPDMKLYWVDGNHEDFSHIKKLPQSIVSEIPQVKNCFYIPRGVSTLIDHRNVMGFGGAASVDRMYRELDVSWFNEEIITDEQINALRYIKNIDILITHDAPINPISSQLGYKNDINSDMNRQQIQKIVDIVQPEFLFHGHYHFYTRYYYRDVNCCGLDCNHENMTSYSFI